MACPLLHTAEEGGVLGLDRSRSWLRRRIQPAASRGCGGGQSRERRSAEGGRDVSLRQGAELRAGGAEGSDRKGREGAARPYPGLGVSHRGRRRGARAL